MEVTGEIRLAFVASVDARFETDGKEQVFSTDAKKVELNLLCGCILHWSTGFHLVFAAFTYVCSVVGAATQKSFMYCSFLSWFLVKAHIYLLHHTKPAPLCFLHFLSGSPWWWLFPILKHSMLFSMPWSDSIILVRQTHYICTPLLQTRWHCRNFFLGWVRKQLFNLGQSFFQHSCKEKKLAQKSSEPLAWAMQD